MKLGESFAAYGAPSFLPGRPILDAANDLSRRIFEDFKYDKRATTISTPIDEVLESRHGVCQDFAHLMIACLRSLDLPALYQRVPAQRRESDGRGSVARVGFRVVPGAGMAGLRPHQ